MEEKPPPPPPSPLPHLVKEGLKTRELQLGGGKHLNNATLAITVEFIAYIDKRQDFSSNIKIQNNFFYRTLSPTFLCVNS